MTLAPHIACNGRSVSRVYKLLYEIEKRVVLGTQLFLQLEVRFQQFGLRRRERKGGPTNRVAFLG